MVFDQEFKPSGTFGDRNSACGGRLQYEPKIICGWYYTVIQQELLQVEHFTQFDGVKCASMECMKPRLMVQSGNSSFLVSQTPCHISLKPFKTTLQKLKYCLD